MEFENLLITRKGEVYNFKDIRKELEDEDVNFWYP
jgi:asparagine synthetase B (glutamine-hydrolysing)